ncbi:hypothetical protein D9757_012559 [Collybiopsis confluens]|uniref:IRG-type G domain-containing protein n=1 Tax=Collybiopsis confluens TaxID=2823264 RepID=A0A8H5G1C9_9AGAR|nr:hypothetical protein D9757_012559 [Collybiopsis confluens]
MWKNPMDFSLETKAEIKILPPSRSTSATEKLRAEAKAAAERARSRAAQAEAERQAEELRRMRAEAEARAAEEARQRAEAEAEAAAARERLCKAQEEAAEKLREAEARAEEERKRVAEAQAAAAEQLRKAQAEAAEAANRANRAAEAEKVARQAAEEEAKRISAEFDQAKQDWLAGKQRIIMPTAAEYSTILRERQYKEGYIHFGVAGVSGCGKSSLINAFRGIINGKKAAAAVGVTETTTKIGRCPDTRPNYPFVWYDVPGAGTLNIPRWQYFNRQGMFIFDCIILLWNVRLTDTDIAILDNCVRYPIPCVIVRSKSDHHIRSISNRMRDFIEVDDTIDDDEREKRLDSIPSEAQAEYCAETRKSIEKNLRNAELPSQRVYMVTNRTLCRVVNGAKLRKDDQAIIDDADLVHDILTQVHKTRCVPPSRTEPHSM